MTWTAGLAVLGGVLALGPIILHLLFRRRYLELEWAAMRFLLESLRRNRQRLRMEELIVIALRVLAILLCGLMLANPRGASFVPGGRAPTAHVFILDDSYSMGQQFGSETLFRRALASLSEQLRALPETDSVAILSASQPLDGNPVKHLAAVTELRREDFSRRLLTLKPKDGAARFPEALAAAKALLESQSGLEPRVCVLSDFRVREFGGGPEGDRLRQAFGALKAEVTLLDFGEPCRANLTLEKVQLLDRVLAAKVPAHFQATVRNHGTEPAANAALMVQPGGVTLPALMLPALGPGETVTKAFSCTFPEAGMSSLKVTLTPDSLPADNTVWLAVEVHESLCVLVADGAQNPYDPAASSSRLLYYALDPTEKGHEGQRVTLARLEELTAPLLARNDLVILTNVREFEAAPDGKGYPLLETFQEFVRGGGGLVIFLGDRVNPEFYNGPLYEGGSGLNPFRLKGGLPAPERKKSRRLRPDSIADPMLSVFTGKTEAFSRLVRFHACAAVEEQAPSSLAKGVGPAEVLARLDDPSGSPVAVRRSFGKGQVLVWYTSSDTRWSDWPKDPSFLAVMNEMTRYYARAAASNLDGLMGTPINLELSDELADAARVTVKTPAYPAEDLQPLLPKGEGRKKSVAYPVTRHAGLYEVEVTLPDQSRRTVCFSRRLDPSEGNLAKAEEAQIRDAAGRTVAYHGRLSSQGPQAAPVEDVRSYWWWFLVAASAVLVLELFLAQRFGHFAGRAAARRVTG